jgi:MFS family permease
MRIYINANFRIGRVVKYFILVDLALLAGWGLIEPLFAIFIKERINGATLVTIGTAAAVYWLLKSVLQLPIANYLDRHPGERDDFYALILGLLVASATAFSFGFINQPWQLYLAQCLHAVGFALYAAAWPAIFSRHLDPNRISFDWALDSTVAGVSAGVSGFFGGVIASAFGFPAVFLLAGIFTFVSALLLLLVPDLVLPRVLDGASRRREHEPEMIGK